MKKFLISVGVLLLLSTLVAMLLDQYQNQNTLLDNPVPNNKTVEGQKTGDNEFENLAGVWMWVNSITDETETLVPDNSEDFIMTISKENEEWRLSSTTDCNSVSGSIIENENTITVGPLMSTKMACIEETLEANYAEQLSRVDSFEIKDNMLTFTFDQGTGKMVFQQKE